jgi:hypothetical protein
LESGDIFPDDIPDEHKNTKVIKCLGCGEIGWVGDDPLSEYRASLEEMRDES